MKLFSSLAVLFAFLLCQGANAQNSSALLQSESRDLNAVAERNENFKPSLRFAECCSSNLDQIAQVHLREDLPAEKQDAIDFDVIAHRGASGYLPEHTLEAYALAYGMGADFIEQDVVLTKDHRPIVLHDIHLDTVTNVADMFPNRKRDDGRYYAIDLTLQEIKMLSVHERVNHESGEAVFPKRFPNGTSSFRIPTLNESIELIQGLNRASGKRVGIYPEIKKPRWHRDQNADISQIVLKTLEQAGYRTKNDAVYLQCFDPVETRRIREELGCKLRLVQLIGSNDWNEAKVDYDTLVTAEGLKTIAEYADGIGPWMPYIVKGRDERGRLKKTELVSMAHRNQLVVHPFTFRADSLPEYVADFGELVRIFRNAGVDGIFTDQTDKAVMVLKNELAARRGDAHQGQSPMEAFQERKAKEAQPKFRYASESVGDEFALVRCEVESGHVWTHNESNQWSYLTEGESTVPGNYACVVATYSLGGVGRNPAGAGLNAPAKTYAIFRVDQRTGRSWVYGDQKFKEIQTTAAPERSNNSASDYGEYRLICKPIRDHFAIYKYNTRTAAIWQYTDHKWKPIETESLPAADYQYKIVPTQQGNDHRLFRFNLVSGEAWDMTAEGFVPVEMSK